MKKENNIRNKTEDADCIFEKKKWISLTGLCNNNCLFCLDGWRTDRFHKKKEEILKKIEIAQKEGYSKLILSGGEPTIHPNIVDFVAFGKKIGFTKIQIITNGRMFANKKFTNNIAKAGLDEVTFSLHGFNSKMHDSLTNVPGSFKQTIIGIKNVFNTSKKIIVNTDTCVTKSNYKYLPKIIEFIVEKIGINEVNLMFMLPYGNAWTNHDKILCEYNDSAPYVHKIIDYCNSNNVHLWLSRFPAEYLEGYEKFIEDPYKLIEEVKGNLSSLSDTNNPQCKGIMCNYCSIKNICKDFLKINEKVVECKKSKYDIEISITMDNLKKIPEMMTKRKSKNILLKLVEPTKRLNDYKKIVPMVSDVAHFLEQIDSNNINISGIPKCILRKSKLKKIKIINDNDIDYSKYSISGVKDYIGLAEELSRKVKIKRISCKLCSLNDNCSGIYQNYVRIFGFNEFDPIIENVGGNHE